MWVSTLPGRADTLDAIVPTPSSDTDATVERRPDAAQPDVLDTREAGPSVIRGSGLRLAGHLVGALAGVVASAVVIRHLGVADTGRYVTVLSLVVIAGSISDLGLSAVGVREYAVRPFEEGHRLLGNLLGMRIAFVAVGVIAATAFAVLADYPDEMVVGTVLAGVGMALFVTQQSLAIPLHVRLRFGAVAGLVLLGQVGVAVAAVVLAVAGAGLLAFFAMNTPVLAVVLVLTVIIGGTEMRVLPAFDWAQWRRLLRTILPYSAAVVLSVLYFRIVQVMVSLLSTPEQTGYFGVSFRVLETLTTIPPLLVSTALPILARAARDDAERFAYAGRRLVETMLIAGLGLALLLFLGAQFCIDVVAGPGYDESVDVLRILAFALVGTFVIAARGYALVSIDSMRAILVSNAIALAVVAAAGVPLISAHGAIGAGITLLCAELTLALCYEISLARHRPQLRAPLSFVGRLLVATAVAMLLPTLLDLPSLVAALAGAVLYVSLLFLMRVVPAELLQALAPRRAARATDGVSLRTRLAELVPIAEQHAAVEGPHAQFGEDRILAAIFAGRDHGWCAEVGAFDGRTGSATLLFEEHGWDCLLVEPIPEFVDQIRRNRRCVIEHCAASSSEGQVTFYVADGVPQMSTVETDAAHHRWIDEVGGTVREITVRTAPLDDLLTAAGFPELQFLTIDVEGHELEVLRGLTLERFRPRIVIIEDNARSGSSEVKRHMAAHGYLNFNRTGVNDWYAHREDAELVQPAAVRRFQRARRLLLLQERAMAVAARHVPEPAKRALKNGAARLRPGR